MPGMALGQMFAPSAGSDRLRQPPFAERRDGNLVEKHSSGRKPSNLSIYGRGAQGRA